jgi:hypothetical protein
MARRDAAWFALWALAGALTAFSALSMGIGLLTAPLALASLVGLAHWAPARAAWGVLSGAGALCFGVGIGNPDHGLTAELIAAGAALALAGGAGYVWSRAPAARPPGHGGRQQP